MPSHGTDVASILREEIGPTAKVVVINDPHGNITPEWEDVAGALLSYKTTPHRDQRRTGRRAAQLLLGLLSASDSWDRPRVTRVPILLKGSLLSYTQPVVQSQPPFAQLRTKARELERNWAFRTSLLILDRPRATPDKQECR